MAKEKTNITQEKEEQELANLENKIDEYTSNRNGTILSGQTLWENENPDVAFAPQEIEIENITTYKKIEIICKSYVSESWYKTFDLPVVEIGNCAHLSFSWAHYPSGGVGYINSRTVQIIDKGINFENARSSGAGVDNNRVIPFRILGYK